MADDDRSADDAAIDGTDQAALQRAAQAAQLHVEAVRAVARFVEDLDDLPGPDALAEFAHLLEVEEEARQARTAALDDVGLSVPSLEPDPE
jgi:ferric-dicitrate binding protein FerR (iron transport regulator)